MTTDEAADKIFGEGVSLLMRKHRLNFSEALDLALYFVKNQPSLLAYMVRNWNPYPTNQPRR